MFDYDIDSLDDYTDNPRFRVVRRPRGIGRFHSPHQARAAARGGAYTTIGAKLRNSERNLAKGRRMTQRIIDAAIKAARDRKRESKCCKKA